MLACGEDTAPAEHAGQPGVAGSDAGASGALAAAGSASSSSGAGGTVSNGGTMSNASGAGGDGHEPSSCLPGLVGTWWSDPYPAYLQIDARCEVTLFCDVDKGYLTTGSVDGDQLTLEALVSGMDVTKTITIEDDALTVLDASAGADLPFKRAEASVVPESCLR